MTGNPLELFRKLFGAVRAIFWLYGSFLASEKITSASRRVRRVLVGWFLLSTVHGWKPNNVSAKGRVSAFQHQWHFLLWPVMPLGRRNNVSLSD